MNTNIFLETTEAEALEIVLKHGYTDKKLINDRLERFKWSIKNLKEFVLTLGGSESVDTGGGYCVSFLELANGDVFAVNGIRALIYPNEEAFWECRGHRDTEVIKCLTFKTSRALHV